MRVAVAMSGGVDSSVVAAIMKEKYKDVFGIHMETCYKDRDINDVLKVSSHLGINLWFADYYNSFHNRIKSYFVSAYHQGLTPNPCVKCNELMKFGQMWEKAKLDGADALATGHYAVAEQGKLFRGIDEKKDQSYFLYRISPNDIKAGNFLFPLGYSNKDRVRRLAVHYGLSVAEKDESQDVCFVGNDYLDVVGSGPSGNILDINGKKIGSHKGICRFTKGQRKGLGSFGRDPLYVIDIQGTDVIAGSSNWLYDDRDMYITDTVWHDVPKSQELVRIQQRYNGKMIDATVEIESDNNAVIKLDGLYSHTSYGQSVVVYRGDQVLGGGILTRR